MKRFFSRLIQDTGVYGFAYCASKFVTFLIFPLLISYFVPADFAKIDQLQYVINLLVVIFVCGQDSSVARFYYSSEDIGYRKKIIYQSLLIQLLLLVVFIPLLYFFSGCISVLLFDVDAYADVVGLVVIQIPFVVCLNFTQNLLKWTQKREKYITISLGYVSFYALSVYVGIKFFNISMYEYFAIHVSLNVLFSVLGIYFIKEFLVISPCLSDVPMLIKFGFPLSLVSVMSFFVPVYERFVIGSYLGFYDLGVFAIASKFAMLINVFSISFQTAWGPLWMSFLGNDGYRKIFNMVLVAFVGVCLFLIVFIGYLVLIFLPSITDVDQGFAATIYFWLALSFFFQAVGFITGIGVTISNRTQIFLWIVIAEFVLVLALLPVSAKLYGIIGACIVKAFCSIFAMLLTIYFSNKCHFIGWDYVVSIALSFFSFFSFFLIHKYGSSGFVLPTLFFTMYVILSLGYIIHYLFLKYFKGNYFEN